MSRCFTCRKTVDRDPRPGLKLFCGRRCFGLSRRKGKTVIQKKAEKKAYDALYRLRDPAALKQRKHEYFQRTYDPVQAAKDRKKRMAFHVEYCRRPEYVAWKREYDKVYRAKGDFGPFWESALLLLDLDAEIDQRATFTELATAKGTLNKSLTRKREYEKQINGG